MATATGAGREADTASFADLLVHLRREYHQIKQADGILQDHRSRWMTYIERWMCQQDVVAAQLQLLGATVAKGPLGMRSAASGSERGGANIVSLDEEPWQLKAGLGKSEHAEQELDVTKRGGVFAPVDSRLPPPPSRGAPLKQPPTQPVQHWRADQDSSWQPTSPRAQPEDSHGNLSGSFPTTFAKIELSVRAPKRPTSLQSWQEWGACPPSAPSAGGGMTDFGAIAPSALHDLPPPPSRIVRNFDTRGGDGGPNKPASDPAVSVPLLPAESLANRRQVMQKMKDGGGHASGGSLLGGCGGTFGGLAGAGLDLGNLSKSMLKAAEDPQAFCEPQPIWNSGGEAGLFNLALDTFEAQRAYLGDPVQMQRGGAGSGGASHRDPLHAAEAPIATHGVRNAQPLQEGAAGTADWNCNDSDEIPSEYAGLQDAIREDLDKVPEEATEGAATTEDFQQTFSEPTVHENVWADLVCLVLRSAKKDFRQLRTVWVQNEVFLAKSLKTFRNEDDRKYNSVSRVVRGTLGPSLTSDKLQTGERALVKNFSSGNLLKRTANMKVSITFNPTSPYRLTWVFVGMALMLFDLVSMPLILSFNPGDGGLVTFANWFSQVYWTLDIYVSFVTGIVMNGELEMRLRKIAPVYIRTWFSFDFLVTIPLWPLMLTPDLENGTQGSLRSVRYLRMLRFLRLARLAKFEHLLGEALAFVNSSSVILCFGIIKLMLYLVLLTHFNACLWYWIGSTEGGWVDGATAGRDIYYKYFCAMHWALTQFQGTSEILPGITLAERIYASTFLMFALIVLASFVSSLTNMMMQLQGLKDERNRQTREIRSYLQSNKISRLLSMRVKRYVDWKLQLLSRQQNDAEVLAILPKLLVGSLLYEVRGPVILLHAFFEMLDDNYSQVFKRLCHEALILMWQAPNEFIFQPTDEANHMYFIQSGTCRYSSNQAGVTGVSSEANSKRKASIKEAERHASSNSGQELTKMESSKTEATRRNSAAAQDTDLGDSNGELQAQEQSNMYKVRRGDWLCEAALWVDWEHVGELEAVSDASVLALESTSFEKVLASTPGAHATAVLYARAILEALNVFGRVYTDYLPEGLIIDFSRMTWQLESKDTEDDEESESGMADREESHVRSFDSHGVQPPGLPAEPLAK